MEVEAFAPLCRRATARLGVRAEVALRGPPGAHPAATELPWCVLHLYRLAPGRDREGDAAAVAMGEAPNCSRLTLDRVWGARDDAAVMTLQESPRLAINAKEGFSCRTSPSRLGFGSA